MRVLHVDTERGFRGGERQLLWLAQEQRRRGVEAELVARAGEALVDAARDAAVPVHEIPQRAPWDPRASKALRRRVDDGRFDVVHAHASHAHGVAVRALRRARRAPPLVVSRRVDFGIGRPPWNRGKYGPAVARFAAISEAIAGVLRRGGVPADRIAVVHSAVAPLPSPTRDRADTRRALGVGDGVLLALTTAALVDHKDHATAIRALAACRAPVRLVVAGDGPLRGRLARLARRLGVDDRVTLLGHRDDVVDLLAAADLYLAASRLEGLNTAVMDAGLARLPVAATRAGGIPEVVLDGRTGLLVEPRQPAALAAALDRLAGDAALRRRLGEAGERRIRERFTLARMVDGTDAVYREVR